MNYQENLRFLAQLCGDSADEEDSDFLTIIPAAINSAENRILRDLDLLATRVTDGSGALTQNSKVFVLPVKIGTFIVLEQLRVILPAGAAGPGGAQPPLLPVSKDTIDSLWPSDSAPSSPSVPNMWAPIDQQTVIVGPPPDQDYPMLAFGTQRPTALSAQNPQTFISTQLQDLMIAAEMLYLSAWQRNWSAQADDPQAAIGWRTEYERLLKAAGVEEWRKKLSSIGWGSKLPPAIATPPQT